MSYILDALRRADAERERDPARGIHARPASGAPAPARGRMPVRLAGVAAVLVVAAAFWFWQQGRTPAAPVARHEVPIAAPAAPAPPPVAAAVSPPAPAPIPGVEKPRVAVVPARAAAAAPASAAAPPAGAAPASDRVFAVSELPADVQRELPRLAITGGVYSDNAAQRMLIVGGQVVNEGAQLAQGVVLEQIRPHVAVLRYRSWRYGVAY